MNNATKKTDRSNELNETRGIQTRGKSALYQGSSATEERMNHLTPLTIASALGSLDMGLFANFSFF